MPRKHKDLDWTLPESEAGRLANWDMVKIAVLMDIRDELKRLNAVFHCDNFLQVPRLLRMIQANTAKPKRKKKRVPA